MIHRGDGGQFSSYEEYILTKESSISKASRKIIALQAHFTVVIHTWEFVANIEIFELVRKHDYIPFTYLFTKDHSQLIRMIMKS